jgi:hypothetical protein
VVTSKEFWRQVDEAEIRYRKLGSFIQTLSVHGVVHSRIYDASRGWVTLMDGEPNAIEDGLHLELRRRVEHNRMLLASAGSREEVA